MARSMARGEVEHWEIRGLRVTLIPCTSRADKGLKSWSVLWNYPNAADELNYWGERYN